MRKFLNTMESPCAHSGRRCAHKCQPTSMTRFSSDDIRSSAPLRCVTHAFSCASRRANKSAWNAVHVLMMAAKARDTGQQCVSPTMSSTRGIHQPCTLRLFVVFLAAASSRRCRRAGVSVTQHVLRVAAAFRLFLATLFRHCQKQCCLTPTRLPNRLLSTIKCA